MRQNQKSMKRILSIVVAAALAVTVLFFPLYGAAQLNTVSLVKGQPEPKAEGVFYSLPRNVLKIDVTVERTAQYKGPYADYARKFLGLNSVITNSRSSYRIEQVNLTVTAERDPENLYFIELPSKSKSTPPLTLQLNEQGILSGILFNDAEKSAVSQADAQLTADFIEQLQPSQQEKTDTIIRRISVDTTTIEERFVRRSVSEKSTEQQAKEAAELIRKIEENKFNLLTGYQEINYSRDALHFMLNRLDSLKTEYLALFKGKSVKSYEQYTYYILPSSQPQGSLESIFRFSPETGIHDKNGFQGESVSVKVAPLEDMTNLSNFIGKRAEAGRKKSGIYYRIPQKSLITLSRGEHEIARLDALISQMGVVTFLPATGISGIKFHPVTGALLMISVN